MYTHAHTHIHKLTLAHPSQSRNTILDGTLPCTKDEAIQLAALQCYIQYGKITSLDNFPIVCGFLPHGYFEIPHAQHAIWNEYEKLQRFTESEAKFAYIQLCRSLPTYGITIFHVKERSKIKLVPILLGISKDTIMTLDLKAKCVVNSWPLNTVHSWAQTSNTFSLVSTTCMVLYLLNYYAWCHIEGRHASKCIFVHTGCTSWDSIYFDCYFHCFIPNRNLVRTWDILW